MTGPITFDPVPVPSRQSIVDIPPSAAAQATTLDANFAKVNTYLQAQPLASAPAFRRNSTNMTGWFPGSAWQSFPASVWPGFSTVLPDADCYVLYIGAEVSCGAGIYVGIGINLTGPGVVKPGLAEALWLSNRSFVSGGIGVYLPRSAFTPGQRLDLAPQFYIGNSVSTYLYFDLAEYGIVGLA